MTSEPNDMFRILSLRRPLSLGAPTRPTVATRCAVRGCIIKSQAKREADSTDLTKLQAAYKRRSDALKRISDLRVIRSAAAALYDTRLQQALSAYEKELLTQPDQVQVSAAKPGLFAKAASFLFGTGSKFVTVKHVAPFKRPPVDASFLGQLVDELADEDQKQIVSNVSAKGLHSNMKLALVTAQQVEAWATHSPYYCELDALQAALDEANDACHEIHVWEDERVLPDTTAKPLEISDDDRPSVHPIGFGELVVARERLVGYDAREIAHIENVLPGEKRLREHTQTTTRETVTETETTEETRSQRDLETTDRFELETQSQKVINTEMKLNAGVNTSGKYGLTTVETSLDAGLSRSQQEAQSSTVKLAQETVSRAVEEIHKSTRELRRITVKEEVKEFNSHGVDRSQNQQSGYSGVYYWVERIHEVELRSFGTRLMIEFFIPEPGLSLLPQNAQTTQPFKKPAPLSIVAEKIGEDNFRCLATLYGAVDVEPPPADEIQVGYAWTSTPTDDIKKKSQDTKTDVIRIPDHYRPLRAYVAVTGLTDQDWWGEYTNAFDMFLTIGGIPMVCGSPQYWVPLDLQSLDPAPDGLTVTIRASGISAKTCAVNIKLLCSLTPAGLHAWQLKTFERIKEAHAALVANYERQVARAQIQGGIELQGRPAAENRAREIEELTKWAIKTMRVKTFSFDAVVRQQRLEEIDPVVADAYAPIMRFFQDAFDWRQMSYLMYPYFWGRRSSYGYRNNLVDPDPLHQAFLRAGAARVIVPVTPGFEERVLHYLDTQGPNQDESAAVAWTPPAAPAVPDDVWLEVLLNKNDELLRGSGTLKVESNAPNVTVNEDSYWVVEASRDVGREIVIEGDVYTITAVGDKLNGNVKKTDAAFWADIPGSYAERNLTIDPPYKGESSNKASYALGSTRVGEPWTVRVPTSLVVLSEQKSKLLSDIDKGLYLIADPAVAPTAGEAGTAKPANG